MTLAPAGGSRRGNSRNRHSMVHPAMDSRKNRDRLRKASDRQSRLGLGIICVTNHQSAVHRSVSRPGIPATCASRTPSNVRGRTSGPMSHAASAVLRWRVFRAALTSRSVTRPQPPQANSQRPERLARRHFQRRRSVAERAQRPPTKQSSRNETETVFWPMAYQAYNSPYLQELPGADDGIVTLAFIEAAVKSRQDQGHCTPATHPNNFEGPSRLAQWHRGHGSRN